ncbi:MAG: 50S ribosomal protein L31e [Candidatus Micrarchaeia archaeon]
MERVYSINLSKVYSLGKHTVRARRAIKEVRRFAARHMKADIEKVVIGTDVNEYIWRDGIQRPPRRLRVKLVKDEKTGAVIVMLEAPAKGTKETIATAKPKKAEEKEAKQKNEQKQEESTVPKEPSGKKPKEKKGRSQ